MKTPLSITSRLAPGRTITLANVPAGMEGLVVADLARALAAQEDAPWPTLVVICRDVERMAELERALPFFAPGVEVLSFPAWDCLPYDRASPHGDIVARRMTTLARLARVKGREGGSIVLTTVNAALQRVPRRDLVATQSFSAAPGNALSLDEVVAWAEINGYLRTSTVRDTGEYARARRHRRPVPAGPAGAGAARFLRRHAGIHPLLRSRDAAHGDADALARPRADERVPAHHRDDAPLPHGLCRAVRRRPARRPAL